jgi:Ca2+-binding RTX toxin-like protein
MPTVITGSNPNTLFGATGDNQTIILAPDSTAGMVSSVTRSGMLLTSYGTINNTAGIGVVFNGSGTGDFINKPDATAIGASDGVRILTLGNVSNQGLIVGGSGHGISVVNTSSGAIVNSGDIFGAQGGITADGAASVSISNSGLLHGDQYGVWLKNSAGAAPSIVNSGTIAGRLDSILAEAGDRLNVTNSGLFSGDVVATSANLSDVVVNNGRVKGNVMLGSGNDTYKGNGTVSGSVFGEDGNDTLSGGAGLDRLFGGNNNDTLTGNGGNDQLDGGAGSDRLAGGLGVDTLTGGAGNDFFVFNTKPNASTNRDIVTDFAHGADKFQLENAVFAKLGGTGALKAGFFYAGTKAHDADDHIIYDRAHGALYYDSNGNAAGGSVLIATLSNHALLTAKDFMVI